MTSETIQKYKKFTVSQLRKKARVKFNKFIRQRDEGKSCCSCDSYSLSDASHFYSAGNFPNLEFNEDNVHASCAKCNRFLHGNLIEYRNKLHYILGDERLQRLDDFAAYYKRHGYKRDRFELIDIIERYK